MGFANLRFQQPIVAYQYSRYKNISFFREMQKIMIILSRENYPNILTDCLYILVNHGKPGKLIIYIKTF